MKLLILDVARSITAALVSSEESEDGQSLVIVALAMVAFLGISGLVIDFGHANVQRVNIQVAADAAALAGARELADGRSELLAVQRMAEVLANNGADSSLSSYTVENINFTVVTARAKAPTFFAQIFGIEEIPVSAQAKAAWGLIIGTDDLMPFAVEEDVWAPGQSVVLWGERTGTGNFGWVRWARQPPSVSNLRANINDPSRSDSLKIGDWVSGSPGLSFQPVQRNLNSWLGREITVFLYDPDQVTGNGANLKYQVTGFARFILASTYSRGQYSEIRGTFVSYVLAGEQIQLTGDPGLRGVALVE